MLSSYIVRRSFAKVFALAILVLFNACTFGSKNTEEPVSATKKKRRTPRTSDSTNDSNDSDKSQQALSSEVEKSAWCEPISKKDFVTPHVLESYPVFITRLMKNCTLPDGTTSYDKTSSWTAMGVPCTSGDGQVRWTDKYLAPKLVGFRMTNACPMIPTDLLKLSAEVTNVLGLDEAARLLAFTPMSIQFWELEGLPELDTGYEIEFRSPQSLNKVWPKVRDGEPLPVVVYGRENSWFQNGPMFKARGEIIVYQRNKFRIDVKELSVLTDEQRQEVRAKCERINPKSVCAGIFD
jgi:hypothetical protein